jgi:hypothetical protein
MEGLKDRCHHRSSPPNHTPPPLTSSPTHKPLREYRPRSNNQPRRQTSRAARRNATHCASRVNCDAPAKPRPQEHPRRRALQLNTNGHARKAPEVSKAGSVPVPFFQHAASVTNTRPGMTRALASRRRHIKTLRTPPQVHSSEAICRRVNKASCRPHRFSPANGSLSSPSECR